MSEKLGLDLQEVRRDLREYHDAAALRSIAQSLLAALSEERKETDQLREALAFEATRGSKSARETLHNITVLGYAPDLPERDIGGLPPIDEEREAEKARQALFGLMEDVAQAIAEGTYPRTDYMTDRLHALGLEFVVSRRRVAT